MARKKSLSERFTAGVKKVAGIKGDSTMSTMKKIKAKKEKQLCMATGTCKKAGVSASVNGNIIE